MFKSATTVLVSIAKFPIHDNCNRRVDLSAVFVGALHNLFVHFWISCHCQNGDGLHANMLS